MKKGVVACPVHGDNETTEHCPDCRPYAMCSDCDELVIDSPHFCKMYRMAADFLAKELREGKIQNPMHPRLYKFLKETIV